MFRRCTALFAVLLVAGSLVACQDEVTSPHFGQPQFGVGNELPSGAHFNLNLIGVKDKKAAMDASNEEGIGHRIFVALYYDDGNNTGQCWEGTCPVDSELTFRKNKILLQAGSDFAVLDANATDGDGALFRMPADVSTTYQVFARPLGKPGGESTITTCSTFTVDPDPLVVGDEYEEVLCSLSNYLAVRTSGKPRTDVTTSLLSVRVDLNQLTNDPLITCLAPKYVDDLDGIVDVPLFDSCFQDYFWDYDNRGLKLLQLRFYPLPPA